MNREPHSFFAVIYEGRYSAEVYKFIMELYEPFFFYEAEDLVGWWDDFRKKDKTYGFVDVIWLFTPDERMREMAADVFPNKDDIFIPDQGKKFVGLPKPMKIKGVS
jgi:hypothetical protein